MNPRAAAALLVAACFLLMPGGAAAATTGTIQRVSHGNELLLRSADGTLTRLGPKVATQARRRGLVGSRVKLAGGQLKAASTPQTADWSLLGQRRIGVISVEFSEHPDYPAFTAGEIRDAISNPVSGINHFFSTQSGGRASFTGNDDPDGDVYGPYTLSLAAIPDPCTDINGLMNEAMAQARDDGFDPDNYENYAVTYRPFDSCFWGGRGSMPGKELWLRYLEPEVSVHELGHNYGATHADSLVCTGVTWDPDECEVEEYGDPFDIMGLPARFMSAYHREMIGELPASQVAERAGTASVHLRSGTDFTVADSEPRMLLLPRRTGGPVEEYLEVELASSTDPFFGVGRPAASVRAVAWNPVRRCDLLSSKASPVVLPVNFAAEWDPEEWWTPAKQEDRYMLEEGVPWTDPVSGVTVTASGISATGFTVNATVPTTVDSFPPRPPTFRPDCGWAEPAIDFDGDRVRLEWQPASAFWEGDLKEYGWGDWEQDWGEWEDDLDPVTWQVWRNDQQVWQGSDTSWEDHDWQRTERAVYRVYAVDGHGNRSTPAVTDEIELGGSKPKPTGDTKPPTRPGKMTLKARGKKAKRGWLLRWKPARDASGIRRYVIYRDKKVIGRSKQPRLVIKNRFKKLKRIKLGVKAIDRAGNHGPRRNQAFNLKRLRR